MLQIRRQAPLDRAPSIPKWKKNATPSSMSNNRIFKPCHNHNAHPRCGKSKGAEEKPNRRPPTTVRLSGSLTHRASGAAPFFRAERSRPRSRPRPPRKRAPRWHNIEARRNEKKNPTRTESTVAGRGGIDLLRRRTPWHARCRRNGTERSSVGTRLAPRTGHRGTGARRHQRSCIGVGRCPPASRSTRLCIVCTPGRSWGTIGSDFYRFPIDAPGAGTQAGRDVLTPMPRCHRRVESTHPARRVVIRRSPVSQTEAALSSRTLCRTTSLHIRVWRLG